MLRRILQAESSTRNFMTARIFSEVYSRGGKHFPSPREGGEGLEPKT